MRDEATGTVHRKQEHLRIALAEPATVSAVRSGFDDVRLCHCALPDLDLAAIDTSRRFLGHTLKAPILISGMTGGVEQGAMINRRLARAAQALGCAMGVGSQRVALEHPETAPHFRVRDVAPDILLFANLGAIQLNYGYGPDECRRAVAMIGADALVLHLNPLQEALQAGGNTNWAGLLERIAEVCAAVDFPVIVKEVGWGLSGQIARQLASAGVAALDVGGAGGTSWSEIESLRAPTEHLRQVGGAFAAWGLPTVDSLLMARAAAPHLPVIASGGLRSGVDVAKAIALGADLAGLAAPLLRAAAESEMGAYDLLAALIDQLRISQFCCGAANLDQLHQAVIVDDQRSRQR